MNFQYVMYMYVSFYILSSVNSKVSRIIGGENADIKDFPFMASLRYIRLNKHFCGGTIISHYHILTAAHCVLSESYYAEIVIYVGITSSVATNTPAYRIQKVDIPDGFTEVTESPDIAVVTLQDYILFNEFQNKAELSREDIRIGANGLISGWGVTDVKQQTGSNQLQKVSMQIIEKSKCQRILGAVEYNGRFCAFQKIGVGICIGDSGSPLIVNGKVVGISSFVIPCARGYPDVYTNIYSQLKFINSVVQNHSYNK